MRPSGQLAQVRLVSGRAGFSPYSDILGFCAYYTPFCAVVEHGDSLPLRFVNPNCRETRPGSACSRWSWLREVARCGATARQIGNVESVEDTPRSVAKANCSSSGFSVRSASRALITETPRERRAMT